MVAPNLRPKKLLIMGTCLHSLKGCGLIGVKEVKTLKTKGPGQRTRLPQMQGRLDVCSLTPLPM